PGSSGFTKRSRCSILRGGPPSKRLSIVGLVALMDVTDASSVPCGCHHKRVISKRDLRGNPLRSVFFRLGCYWMEACKAGTFKETKAPSGGTQKPTRTRDPLRASMLNSNPKKARSSADGLSDKNREFGIEHWSDLLTNVQSLSTIKFKSGFVVRLRRQCPTGSSSFHAAQRTRNSAGGPGSCGDVFVILALIDGVLLDVHNVFFLAFAVQLGVVVGS